MRNRREFILANAAAIPALAMLAARDGDGAPQYEIKPMREPPGPSAAYFPNVPVVAHTGSEYLWYDDVIRDRSVVINFFSIDNDEKYAVTDNLMKAHRLAAEKGLGNVRMVSVAAEAPPLQVLADYAARKRIGERWLFFTGARGNIELIRSFLYIKRVDPAHGAVPGHGEGHDYSLAVARYGNESLARWASFPVQSSLESIVRRFAWI